MKLPDQSRLFVGGISPGTGVADLRRHFQRFGEVADVYVPRDHRTGQPRRFAFVQFARSGHAVRALAGQHHVINGRAVDIKRAEPRCANAHRIKLGKYTYRIGGKIQLSYGPFPEPCGDRMDYLKKFGRMEGGLLLIEGVVESISEDGKICRVRIPDLMDEPLPSGFCCPRSVFAGLSEGALDTGVRVVNPDDVQVPSGYCCPASVVAGALLMHFLMKNLLHLLILYFTEHI